MISARFVGIGLFLLLSGEKSAAFPFVQRERTSTFPGGILRTGVHNGKDVFMGDFERTGARTKSMLSASGAGSMESVGEERDVSPLEAWAVKNNIQVSPSVSMTSESDDGSSTNYGLSLTKSLKEYETVLSVPKEVVLDSEYIRREWGEFISPSLEYIEAAGLNDSALNFVLMAKILLEHSMGEKSIFYDWICTLPKTFDTGVCMDEVERSCLPPFALAIANFETQQLEIFRKAFEMVKETDLFKDVEMEFTDEITLWAFNVVTTRSWRYQQDKDDDDMIRPIMVPFGDMFNHKEPPNVMVRDADDFDAVEFVLAQNIEVDESGEEGSINLYLSYGLTNPHRFLTVFGFVDDTMPEVFSQLLFDRPTPELINLGCNDRSKMVYRTSDGGVSTTVWDCILFTLLAQVPLEQDEFYTAHIENDLQKKLEFHRKYALEESLTLRNHVEGTANEFKELMDRADELRDDEAHPRMKMIRFHNEFLFKTFSMVLQRIDARAQSEVMRRRGIN